ncbi:hypothetical protein PG984_011769 [Apiospora sp. TS-2023a]
MSGLEPIAALGLACNILQVVGIGRDTVRIAKQVYQDGTLDPALTASAGVLDDLAGQIRATTAAAASAAKPKAQDKQLLDLADKCQGAARDLQEEVNFLNGLPTKAKLIATLKVAAKTTWRKRRLEKLDQKLKDSESLLQTGLLTRIYERSVKTNDDILSLDTDIRAFIDEYRKGHVSAADMTRKHITTETKKSEDAVKSHITQTSNRTEKSLKEQIGVAIRGVIDRDQDTRLEAKRHQLLQSLKFDRMNERRNQVSSSHPDTFTWVLRDGSEVYSRQGTVGISDDEDSVDRAKDSHRGMSDENISWDSFTDWLRSTDTVYWISGMPGSGKSTLTKYLLAQSQTQKCLDLWKPEAIIISHFFWGPGTAMQQSIRGLLFSLLYQLILEDVPAVDEVRINYDEKSAKDNETDWSDEELLSALHLVVTRYRRPIAIFLDGLDEVLPRDGVLKLLEVVDWLKTLNGSTGNLKICLGSRREPLFCKRLCAYPQLRLENLNIVDLRKYGKDNIVIPSDYHITGEIHSWPQDQAGFKRWLVDSLVEKAGGVFLWLCLTVSTITKALNEGETVEDLVHRIDNLPKGLVELYADMWARMNHDSLHLRARAASYLQVALEGLEERGDSDFRCPCSPYIMMAATTPGITDLLLQPDLLDQMPSASQILEACEITRRDIANRCGGILVCPNLSESRWKADDKLIPWHGEEYNSLTPYIALNGGLTCFFLHRTARDFLTDTEEGKKILSWGSFAGDRASLQLIKARLTIYRLFRVPVWSWDGAKFGYSWYNNEVADVLDSAIFQAYTPYHNQELEPFVRPELSRLLLVCEQLFNYGYLCGRATVEPNTIPSEQNSELFVYHAFHEITVQRQHEFLLEAGYCTFLTPSFWDELLSIVENRALDGKITSQLLVCACTFGEKDPSRSFEAIRSLLARGASPCHKTLQRDRLRSPDVDPLIWKLETPFQALIASILSIETRYVFDNSFAKELLDLVSLMVAHGASLNDEVHIAIKVEMKTGRMRFMQYWKEQDYFKRSLVLIMSYPASSVLADILRIWQLKDISQMSWLPDPPETTRSGFGQGHPIVLVVEKKHTKSDEPLGSAPGLFLTEGIFPLETGNGLDEDLLPLIRVVEDRFQGNNLPEGEEFAYFNVGDGILSRATVPKKVLATVKRAIARMRSTKVPVAERRKEVRVRLRICTPLEDLCDLHVDRK